MKTKKNKKEEHRIKLLDLVDITEMEVRLSIVFTFVITALFAYLQLYNKFYLFEEKVCSVIEMIVGSFVGLLGFSVSGIAIIITLFTREETFLISELNGENDIEKILESYKFLAESLAVEIFYLIMIDICISSDGKMINKTLFGILLVLIVYHFCFNVFYLIALIKNFVELYKIKRIYGELENIDGEFNNDKNDIRIDFILATIMNICGCSQDEVCEGLIEFVKNSSIRDKERMIKYFSQRYGKSKE